MMRKYFLLFMFVLVLLLTAGCRGEIPGILGGEEIPVDDPSGTDADGEAVTTPDSTLHGAGEVKGFFLLNEGNMGSNKCTLDFFDATTGRYRRNLFPARNPDVVKELGDVGNDIAIYGQKLYVVVNCSHLVEVMDARTARHIGRIDITNCRNIVFADGKAYVSSYAGPVQISPEKRPGKVVEVDTASLTVTREVVVGYQPEEMVLLDGKLYVANSGGYQYPDYDRTISVVDLNTFQVTDTIDVAVNLHRMELAPDGMIYVSSRGDYYGVSSDVYQVDPKRKKVVGHIGVPANEMTLCGDSLFLISSGWSYVTESYQPAYVIYDTRRHEVVSRNFITDGTDRQITIPYGLAVHPQTREIYVTDARDYVTPGYLYCFSPEGRFRWKVRTGDIPAHFAFTTMALQ